MNNEHTTTFSSNHSKNQQESMYLLPSRNGDCSSTSNCVSDRTISSDSTHSDSSVDRVLEDISTGAYV